MVDEFSRREATKTGVWANLVVVPAPEFYEHRSLGSTAKPFETQTFVSELVVEARAILPWLAGVDGGGLDVGYAVEPESQNILTSTPYYDNKVSRGKSPDSSERRISIAFDLVPIDRVSTGSSEV